MNENRRPKRKHIPVSVKREVVERQGFLCKCGCGMPVASVVEGRITILPGVHFDHEPALRLRDVNRAGTDYIPPQNSPRHIDARCAESHRVKTSGAGASIAGTDLGKIVKERKRARKASRARLAKRLRRVQGGQKPMVPAGGLPARSPSKWVSRKIASRPFPKIKRPMRRKV